MPPAGGSIVMASGSPSTSVSTRTPMRPSSVRRASMRSVSFTRSVRKPRSTERPLANAATAGGGMAGAEAGEGGGRVLVGGDRGAHAGQEVGETGVALDGPSIEAVDSGDGARDE